MCHDGGILPYYYGICIVNFPGIYLNLQVLFSLQKKNKRLKMSKPGRNDPCSCGSGEKFKKCCEKKIGLKKIQAHLIPDPSKGSASETMKISQSFFQKIVPSNPTLEHKNIQKKDAEG
ncbi:MAG: hypothetical protein EB051_05080 [Chlamydiia bacterium]|nr:hypothetical protein [Chlamydiia bacterium]